MRETRETPRSGTPFPRSSGAGQGSASDQVGSKSTSSIPRAENGYNFVATDSLGNTVKGFSPTPDPIMAVRELERAGMTVESLKPIRGKKKTTKKPTGIELATLAEQFGDLMEIGESPTQVCRLLAFAQTNDVLARSLLNAGEMVMNGMTLSEAFAAQKDAKGNSIYPVTFVTSLRIGEEIGTATDSATGTKKSAFLLTLGRFAETEKKAEAIRSSIKSALMYPIGVLAFSIVAVFAVLYFVMPRMVDLYSSLLSGDAQLPIATRALIGASDVLTSVYGLGLIAGSIIAGLLFARWARTPGGDDFIKSASLRAPVFGGFFRLYYASQTLRTLAMLSAGIPSMTERFQIAAETSTNPEYRRMLNHVRHRFMIESTELTKLFIPYSFLMGKEFGGVLLTYEKTADMQETFHNYAKLVEVKAERELEQVLFFFQNFAIVPVGVIIGFIVIALYSPMFELAGKIGQ
jgi:type IV pilus assembly protein PilC